ncbi:hypothetical protein HA052_08615 [Chromobacterium haemolyticum]|uniref:Transposase n=1 Tax=Chromobacterium fluminis TaxID=3044269 RepID=A0ABX0L833_9NEIS|nr:hypothetical protein [Chromobacterium haemolyticum]NHR05263.1 hypothetical protein [Chromobacterium haemolyticum]
MAYGSAGAYLRRNAMLHSNNVDKRTLIALVHTIAIENALFPRPIIRWRYKFRSQKQKADAFHLHLAAILRQ